MDISRFDYQLSRDLIAQKPADPRDSSRLLVLDRNNGETRHTVFYNIINYLNSNDVLILNKSKVFPARLYGTKMTKGKVEVLILRFLQNIDMDSRLPSFTQGYGRTQRGDDRVKYRKDKRGILRTLSTQDDNTRHSEQSEESHTICEAITKPGLFLNDRIQFEGFEGNVKKRDGYITLIEFDLPHDQLLGKINLIGHTPIPPYINKSPLSENDLREKYQTVYAKSVGSAAAPTAGLHFTNELLKKLRKKGVQTEYVTLHVGLGTFAPVKEKDVEKHKIHEEYFEVDGDTLKRLNKAKKEGKRIITVGTTTTRVLETLAFGHLSRLGQLEIRNFKDSTNLFIFPPYKFHFVDALITNFHLPKSTLLALVSAFVSYPNLPAQAGTNKEFTDFRSSSLGRAYNEAIKQKYRFFSFGDAMMIK
ncbi:MAG: S-adenosylmethionine:tRNA ribosyltransferase-isomerase [Candidatus Woesebacteria bacterium GW2011_GWC1_38_13]|uniref:S-adenosylmethionine:tRNA ribosyltransferase-isomerase n=3 Tax=Candidatus Woeseibacteriota TaxID=1752722 RepID=A0A0G0NCZ1_9BACT|nr:MAG: S-adenosylmethionine:tRNA ribosyltransferase-isomerase [Candidatus Woesebacteria bacterium GW2011_GWD1_38_10]KKQ56748.1 MAG: S-adenosylmethionine:tRNA ribosyltransferase-isomerase [Candidatus Woesebacteria bacterium GW2011_GWC1_38_13]KKQ83749.1 MAG: S-adenosylmethionine:tRNA ribosyltransferase-isomerase [Candidatus Woesebacteria bacterium GW2011_GWA1_38_8]